MVDVFKVSYSVFKEAATRYEVFHFFIPSGDGYVLGTGHEQIVYTTTITDPTDVNDFINNILFMSIQAEAEGDVIASPTLSTTGNLQKQFDLSDSNFIYLGAAKPGVATSLTGWTIKRFTLDVAGNVVDQKTTVVGDAVWDDRVIEVYS
jgi:hypothetical protein